ncbi:FAD-dependent oxidoreductase [Duganella sp. FT3S]|uniref:FAD-dependent oxidoreductase n=1 Tax=Rugamonas fusca TaxID=2758568 RepID=A0A7W2EDV6_9BURK|nr:FAD-dependent oxidoreductase [Rugamonas fusca]MBA5604117.1 FAD-dependent oxidoreductase [Rugamonas fusca]
MLKKKLVVIGGGSAGHKIAYLLQDTLDVTLVDPKTYFEVPMALPRLLVEPNALPAQLRYQHFLPGVRHVQGKAVSIAARSVVVDTGAGSVTIPFDFAVVATGSRCVDPLIKAEVAGEGARRAQIADAQQRLKTARSVVVAGGGPVGVEIAAELCESFPRLSVTLVHGAGQLLERAPSKFGDWALGRLIAMGARVLLDDPVTQPAIGTQPVDGKVRTKGGKLLDAGLVIWAAGARPNTGFVAASWPALVQDDGLLLTAQLPAPAGLCQHLRHGRRVQSARRAACHHRIVPCPGNRGQHQGHARSPIGGRGPAQAVRPAAAGQGDGQDDDRHPGPRRRADLAAIWPVPRGLYRPQDQVGEYVRPPVPQGRGDALIAWQHLARPLRVRDTRLTWSSIKMTML